MALFQAHRCRRMKITAPIVALHLRDQDDLPGNVVVVGENLVFDFALSEYLMHAALLACRPPQIRNRLDRMVA